MSKSFNCYDCKWCTDKCKNGKSENYNRFAEDIERCNVLGIDVDNSSRMSSENYRRWLAGEDVDLKDVGVK